VITQLKTEFASWDRAKENLNFPSGRYPMLSAVFVSEPQVGVWVQYGDSDEDGVSLRFDEYLGHSSLDSSDAYRFCVNYRVDNLENPELLSATENDYWDLSVWEIRVRVSWTREGFYHTNNTAWRDCSPTQVDTRILDDLSDDVVEMVSTATRELAR
jgi:hypothetical protein